ncbi:anti-sigma factor family protein [Noviherbaspirillum galbum]|uniref:Anti-sigma factor n=1 Tax=Noviherbaspirillum galbum TaxID=2709383 RepID=A0A6B3SNY8_9BURK|nr:anti-sigma factor [Noviherbaspirillum galbum]NEX60182.1 anti-sigma factor [Noviherbaspirillum galbum]
MTQLPVTEADLHAYVDGLLPESRRDEIEAYLAARPEEAARLQAYRNQNDALRKLFNPVLSEPVPARLNAVPHRRSWMLQQLAAGLAIAFLGGGAGWMLHERVGPQAELALAPASAPANVQRVASLARQAAIAHVVYSPDVKRPVEIGADQEDQLVTWLSKRIGSQIRPPKLGKLGYELIGGRLLPGETGPVAQFMYHDVAGQRLTLYVSTEQAQNKDTGFRFAQEGPVNVFYWIDGKFGYALSAGADKGELARIATVVYEQLQKT